MHKEVSVITNDSQLRATSMLSSDWIDLCTVFYIIYLPQNVMKMTQENSG